MDTGTTIKPSLHKLGRITVTAVGLALLLAVLAAPLAVSLDWQVAWAPRALAAGTLIDDFTTCPQAVLAPPTASDTATSCGISVLGGARTVAIERTGGGLPTNLFIYEDSGTGFAALANGPGVSSIATITWDADGVGLGSGAGVDISLEEGVNLTVNFSDLGVEVTIRLTDVDDNVSTSTKSFGQTLPPGAPFFFDFDNFTGSADLTKIKKIELVLVGGNASDTIITLVELEDPEVDFGDLPDGPNFPSFLYGTLLANDGPRHIIDTNLLLGKGNEAKIDAELNGQPSVDAKGDDDNGLIPDDEEGVPGFPELPEADGSYPVTVDYVNTTGSEATIAGWIDFDQSGTFEDDESATVTVPTTSVAGDSEVLPFVMPSEDIIPGLITFFYARVRIALNAVEVEDPTGFATTGEVEDYRTGIDIPLSVDLGYVYAERRDDGTVSFVWETATESGNAGFNLYMEVDGQQSLVNAEMIPSSVIDSVTPVAYAYDAVVAGDRFYIELVTIGGENKQYGPFAVGEASGSASGSPQTPGLMEVPIYLPIISGR